MNPFRRSQMLRATHARLPDRADRCMTIGTTVVLTIYAVT
jgi:hypothetical protein